MWQSTLPEISWTWDPVKMSCRLRCKPFQYVNHMISSTIRPQFTLASGELSCAKQTWPCGSNQQTHLQCWSQPTETQQHVRNLATDGWVEGVPRQEVSPRLWMHRRHENVFTYQELRLHWPGKIDQNHHVAPLLKQPLGRVLYRPNASSTEGPTHHL